MGSHNTARLLQTVGLMKIVINANFIRFHFPLFCLFLGLGFYSVFVQTEISGLGLRAASLHIIL